MPRGQVFKLIRDKRTVHIKRHKSDGSTQKLAFRMDSPAIREMRQYLIHGGSSSLFTQLETSIPQSYNSMIGEGSSSGSTAQHAQHDRITG